jgi:hypothetical protein
MDSEFLLSVFDLHLVLYRSIKNEIETKIDFDIKLKELKGLGLLKNYKYPFFVFKDNRNINNRISIELENSIETYQNIIDTEQELFLIYKNYLPRTNTLMTLKRFPLLEEYFQLNKRGVNQLNRFLLDPLISEKENLDWFIYDDESLNFLMDMEKLDFNVEQTVRYNTHNEDIVYFQDKYPYVILSNKEHKQFLIVLILNNVRYFLNSF